MIAAYHGLGLVTFTLAVISPNTNIQRLDSNPTACILDHVHGNLLEHDLNILTTYPISEWTIPIPKMVVAFLLPAPFSL